MSQENRPMDERRMMKIVVVGLVIFGLLLAGIAIQNAAWTQGYTMGLLTSGTDGADLAPYLLYRTGPGAGGAVGFFGGLARFLFVALLAVGLLKLLGFGYWRRRGGPPPWAGHHGPWCEQSMQTESTGESGQSGSTETSQRPAAVDG
jgi:hypothetical protein